MKQIHTNKDDRIELNGIPWKSVLPHFGIGEDFLRGVHGPCPVCGGKDRFRFANHHGNKNGPEIGMWHCNQCGSGNGYELIRHVSPLTDAEIFRQMKVILGGAEAHPAQALAKTAAGAKKADPADDARKTAERLNALWQEAQNLSGDDPVSRYLKMRVPDCDLMRLGSDVRFHPALPYYHYSADNGCEQKLLLGTYPGMLLRVRALCGEPINIHRTFLTQEGEKASVPNVKKLMTGTRTLNGAAIRVFENSSRTLGVCEGFETGLAVARARRYGISVWSLINAGNLAKADIPREKFDQVLIFADHDMIDQKKGYRPGEYAAQKLKERLLAEGFEVEISVPKHQGQDFADVWVEWWKMRGLDANGS